MQDSVNQDIKPESPNPGTGKEPRLPVGFLPKLGLTLGPRGPRDSSMQARGMLPLIMALKEPYRVLYGLWRALGCYYPPPPAIKWKRNWKMTWQLGV